MKPFTWVVLVAIGIAVVGVFLGIAGALLLPIVGLIAVVALVIWLLERRAHGKPPIR